jgi:hypothetical protein
VAHFHQGDGVTGTPVPSDQDVEERLLEFFERNLGDLQAEGGHALAPEVKETALRQVKMYWRKLREIAERVTDTEVKLSLPDQRTPRGRTFAIEGVVDIVREEGRTTLYDIKTHRPEEVRANLDLYARQLAVYAHIWQGLRGEGLDQTAVICTPLPPGLDEAMRDGDEMRVAQELSKWEPVIQLPFDPTHLESTISDFARVVDQIEDHVFAPPTLTSLKTPLPGVRVPFGSAVCRNCDARFSCDPFRRWLQISRSTNEAGYRQYIEDLGPDMEREAYVEAALSASDALPTLDDVA